HDEVAFVVFRDDTDGVGSGGCTKLDGERAQTSRSAPHQHVMSRPKDMRPVPEQHSIGRGERQRVASALFPRQMSWPLHELPVLHPRELGERAIRSLVA